MDCPPSGRKWYRVNEWFISSIINSICGLLPFSTSLSLNISSSHTGSWFFTPIMLAKHNPESSSCTSDRSHCNVQSDALRKNGSWAAALKLSKALAGTLQPVPRVVWVSTQYCIVEESASQFMVRVEMDGWSEGCITGGTMTRHPWAAPQRTQQMDNTIYKSK